MPGLGDDSFINDISADSGVPNLGQFGDGGPVGMTIHHSNGSSLNGLISTLRQRGLGAQYAVDRDGTTYRLTPEGTKAAHMLPGWGDVGEGLSNNNMAGVELVAKDNSDVTPAQIAATQRLINWHANKYGYDPETSVVGHGEVNPGHKEADEGMAVVNAMRDASSPAQVNVAQNGAISGGMPALPPFMALGGPQPAPLQPQPDNKPMANQGGILSAPQIQGQSDYAKQLQGILGQLGTNNLGAALTALGAGIAGNSTRGWGAGIGAGLEGANQAMTQNTGQRMSLLEALANEQARQQQLALQAAQQRQALELANRPKFERTGTDVMGNPIFGPVSPVTGMPLAAPGAAPGQPVAGANNPLEDAVANNVTGEEFLKSVPTQLRAAVKATGDYDAAPPSAYRASTPQGMYFRSLVKQYNPGYDEKNYAAANNANKSFKSGPDAAVTAAYNTAMQHAAALLDIENKLDNGPRGWVNYLRNANREGGYISAPDTQFQHNKGDFDVHRVGLSLELDKAFKGAGQADVTGVKEIQDALAKLGTSAPPEAVRGAVMGAISMLGQRMESQRQKLNTALGTTDRELPSISPDALTAYAKIMGPEAAAKLSKEAVIPPTAGGAMGPQGSAPVKVSTPEEAMKLPKGTAFLTPDGRLKVRP